MALSKFILVATDIEQRDDPVILANLLNKGVGPVLTEMVLQEGGGRERLIKKLSYIIGTCQSKTNPCCGLFGVSIKQSGNFHFHSSFLFFIYFLQQGVKAILKEAIYAAVVPNYDFCGLSNQQGVYLLKPKGIINKQEKITKYKN